MLARSTHLPFATTLFLVAILALYLGLGIELRTADAQAGTIIRVNAANNEDAGNDGSSWDKAYVRLPDAFGAANSGAQIWVAKGVYYPDEGVGKTNDSMDERFTLESGVALYGGFAGTESQLSQRDGTVNISILSGDIQKNDSTGPDKIVTNVTQIVGTNSTNLVYSNQINGARLDGFVITGGAAIQDSSLCTAACGGGLYANASNLTLANITFSGNKGYYGGGALFIGASTSNLTNILFTANKSEAFGGGLQVQEGAIVNAKDVGFENNEAVVIGGGVAIRLNGEANFEGATFTGNQSQTHGGAIYGETSIVSIKDAIFTRNGTTDDGQGGAIYQIGGTLKISYTEINCNRAWGKGGGVSIVNVNATLSNVKFLGNYVATLNATTAFGGGMAVEGGSLATSNVLFSGNHSDDAGALYLKDIDTTLRQVTIAEQDAPKADTDPFAAHGILVDSASINIENSIVWAKGQRAVQLVNGGGYFGGNTVFEGPDAPMNAFGIMRVSASPFRSLPNPGNDGYGDKPNTPDEDESANDNYGDLQLNGTTAAIDAGANANLPTDLLDIDGDDNTSELLPLDLDEGTRVLRMTAATAIVDPGAYEYVNIPPAAKIVTPTAINEGGSIELDATGSTDDSGIVSYQWDCTNNSSTDVTEDSPTQGICTYPNSGNHTLRLTATDSLNAAGTATANVTVNNIAPTFTPAANQNVTANIAAALDLGTFTDPGAEGTWAISINWGDNSTATQFNVNSMGALPAQSHAFPAAGSYNVTVTINDDAANDSGTFQVQVGATIPGTPSITPPGGQNANAGTEKSFALGSFTDEGSNGPWQVTINWGDGTPNTAFSVTSGGALPGKPHTYAQGGTYEVFITVSDGVLSSSVSFQITIPVQEGSTIFLPNARK